ncbi:MAG: GDP-mannose 4,6-dehydratase [Candidatus Taylorbacteria bacterium]|nr:GDP-mannose 4,6-dehydratase [Candidatus Taylorbacteria bacterium]
MKKYLLIGGAGFIGINFADALLSRGDEVTVFDNFSRKGTEININWLKSAYKRGLVVVRGDIRSDFEILKKLAEEHDVIHHLAAQVAVTTSTANPREDFEINALGTFNVLEAVRLSKRKPMLIYASTNKVYGGMDEVKIAEKKDKYDYKDIEGISEKQPLDFHSPYGCSKGAGDQYVRDYSRIYGLKTVVMRQSCIYGPHQFGVEDQGWVAWFIIATILGKDITIYGNGKQVRDVLHVRDLFELWDIAEKNATRSSGKAYNVGGGPKESTSLLAFLAYLEKISGNKIPLKFSDWRPGDQPVYISDISKVKKDLGWKPATKKEKGFTELYEWALKNKEVLRKALS